MDRLRPLWNAARPEHALLVPLCVEIGAACAHFDAQPGPGLPAHLLIGSAALAAGLGVNLIDHVWDLPGVPRADPKKQVPEHERPLPGREAAISAAACLLVAALLAGALAPLSGAAALGYGTLAVLLGIWRRAPAIGADALGYSLGDVATGIALGPLAVLTGFASQAGIGSPGAFYASLPVASIAMSCEYARHFTRRAVDANLLRMTPVASWGDDRARSILICGPAGAGFVVLIVRAMREYPPSAWIACAPLVAMTAVAAWRLRGEPTPADYDAVARTYLWGAVVTLVVIFATLRLGAPA